MALAQLTIDLDAIRANWRALDRMSRATTGAVVKANAYGLGLKPVARALAAEGARSFFVALAEEGAALREVLGPGPAIHVFSGHMEGDAPLLRAHDLIPMINSPEQMQRHAAALAGHGFGLQLDTGMSRLGVAPDDWPDLRAALPGAPSLVMSHLACADAPGHPMNAAQRDRFAQMTGGLEAPRSLSATGGILLGPDYHFEMTRPGIGLYGGLPFAQAAPAVNLRVPVIQTRALNAADTVGYGATWSAGANTVIATISAGYADGFMRIAGPAAAAYHKGTRCPIRGRVSMDLIGVDVTGLAEPPAWLELICPQQSIDDLAEAAGTIGYEILTALGPRYARRYKGEIR